MAGKLHSKGQMSFYSVAANHHICYVYELIFLVDIMQKLESVLTQYFCYLDRKGRIFNAFLGVVCIVLVFVFDIYSPAGYESQFLFIVPIAFSTWFGGLRAGLLTSVIGTAFLARYHYIEPLDVALWNVFSALGLFCVISVLLFKIRELLEKESHLSRIDPLTGVMNLRAFKEITDYEMLRSKRECRPFSIAYFDIDNFKDTNDHYGHSEGDELLKAVVTCVAQNIRKTDVIARMGGDEFVVFFPSTDQNSVKVVTQKITEELKEYSKKTNWPTTVSMGIVTCVNGTCNLEQIISTADKLMYEVKSAGKNNVLYAVLQESASETRTT